MRTIMFVFISILIGYNTFAQISCDTLYLNDGKIIFGTINQQYGSSSIKIKTLKGNLYSYNNSSIRRLGFGYKKEMAACIYLATGDSICGEIVERKYNSYLKVKTSENKIVQLFDFEINKVENRNYSLSKIYIVHLKDNIFWGNIENQKKNNIIIVRNTWSNQLTRIGTKEVLKIDSITTDLNTSLKIIHLADSMQMKGYLKSFSLDYVFLRTIKYGDFLIKKEKISRIDDFIENIKKIEVVQEKVTVADQKVTEKKEFKDILSNIKDSIKLYKLNAVASFGLVSSRAIYYLPQLGVNAQFIKFGMYCVSSEVRLGLSTNFNIANFSINLSPLIFTYNVYPDFSAEIMPDIHLRLYDGGSRTTLGLIAGGKYNINSDYAMSLRMGYSGGFFLGISGQYDIKYKNILKRINSNYEN